MTIWSNQTLVFNYYFPDFGDVFTGSPISFVADGSPHLSTLSTLSPATFSVSGIAPDAVQIAYFYSSGSFNLNAAAFNGFNISGPVGDLPIAAAFVDSGSTVIGLTDGTVSFAAELGDGEPGGRPVSGWIDRIDRRPVRRARARQSPLACVRACGRLRDRASEAVPLRPGAMIDADTRNGIELRRGAVFLGGGATVWSAGGRTVCLTAGMFASGVASMICVDSDFVAAA